MAERLAREWEWAREREWQRGVAEEWYGIARVVLDPFRSLMRIAFSHNLKTSDSIEEAEYDTEETVRRIASALEAGGHEVYPINMNGTLSSVAARLEALSPDLIFNTAEGRTGRFREAFFPALFEHLRIPSTGGGP